MQRGKILYYSKPDDPEFEHIIKKFHSVEIKPLKSLPIYQFKLYQNSLRNGASVHVRPDSEILNYLKPGEEHEMKYYPKDSKYQIRWLKTQILNIVKEQEGPFKGHFQISFTIVD